MIKIGIITMHRVLNCGSALQAYALQKSISDLGFKCEIIDYQYGVEKSRGLKNAIKHIIFAERNKKFSDFYNAYFNCSQLQYFKETIKDNPPDYDIYCTGSDQVWNPRFIENDTNFMLSFAPDCKPRFSYAASFTTGEIPKQYISLYKKYLSKYKFISVREQSGVQIIQQLLDRKADLVCDPTLLLDNNKWDIIANSQSFQQREKYILVYKLGYMFDSRREVYKITDKVQKELGYKVYYLNGKHDLFRNGKKILNFGPSDFINYIKNSAFVITDSFHGTIFSAIYNRPFISVVTNKNIKSDNRISTLLSEIGGEKSLVESWEQLNFAYNYQADMTKLKTYSLQSANILKNMLDLIIK